MAASYEYAPKLGFTNLDHIFFFMFHIRGCFRKEWYPEIIHINRVFDYFHHPFWGTPIFGNTHVSPKDMFFKHGFHFP